MKKTLFILTFFTTTLIFHPVKSQNIENGHEWIDLGLSVNWATCNVGANTPQENGYYFAWGEIAPKANYYLDNYKFTDHSKKVSYRSPKFTKYNGYKKNGVMDFKDILDKEDDAAYVNWGGAWRIPTIDELMELLDCKIDYYNDGIQVTGPNGNSIYLPAAGSPRSSYTAMLYWANELSTKSENALAYVLNCFRGQFIPSIEERRYCGGSIRPVCPKSK